LDPDRGRTIGSARGIVHRSLGEKARELDLVRSEVTRERGRDSGSPERSDGCGWVKSHVRIGVSVPRVSEVWRTKSLVSRVARSRVAKSLRESQRVD
jgi:hypothetical protein